ncbi:MAG: Gfo/Idh/MocA family oxidoreductase [Clostridia bacterium]|nr:Gfo/Idh/MocA family oxidoreductase [Clostridia bacterium]MBR0509613.1 Gfo/Idh/MocA family oxidoreductase [Clostridia bacterium]
MKKIKIGIAGTRGLSTLMGLKAIEDVEITAMCDLDETHLNEAADKIGVSNRYRVFDDMLESDVDAVIIATPMQCHVPQAIAALEAGKHVMSEVTAGVSMDELFWLCECVEKYGKIYMYAENYIYTPEVQLVKSMVRAGLFGEPYYAEGMYMHNIGSILTYPNGKRSWRSYWQCGKRGNFYPTHSIGPVMQWFPGDRITEISTFSPGVWNDVGLKQDSGTTTMCRTEKGKLLNIRTDCMSAHPHNMDFYHLQGTLGCYRSKTHGSDFHRVSFIGEDSPIHAMQWKKLEDFEDYLPDRFKYATEEQKHAGHGGGDFFIVEDFINAVRDNKQPDLDVYTACEWTAVGLLSALSVTNNAKHIEIPHFRKNMPLEEKIVKL